jgi:hypothetical protein
MYACLLLCCTAPYRLPAAYSCDIPASAKAYRIKLGQDAVLGGTGEGAGGAAAALAWEEEDMPEPRGLTDAVMLPDGRIVLLNGAKVRLGSFRPGVHHLPGRLLLALL